MTQYDLIKHLSWHQCFSLILIGCGVPVYFYLGFHLPIFTDEVAWKIASSRYQVDQGLSVSLLPLCSAKAFLTKVPSVFVPAALLESFLYQDLSNLIKLRWYGSISLALFFLSVFVLCYIVNLGHRPHSILNSFITSMLVFLVGVLPLNLFINRPEQPMSLILIFLLILTFWRVKNPLLRGANLILFLFLVSYFFFLHAKALFLLPFIFFLGLKWELKKALKLIVCLFTLWCGYESFAYYLAKSSCTENPALAAWVSGHMVSPREFISEPAKTSLGLLTNLLNFRSYFYGILFSKHQGWWLRDATGWSGWVRFVNAGIKYWLYFWMGLLTIEALKFIKGRRNLDGLLVAGLLVGVIGLSAMMRLKTPYEANFIFPLLIIITAITLRETSSTSLGWQWSQRGFLLLALVSLFLNLRFFQPYIETDLQTSGRLARLTNGYSAFNIQTPHDQIRQLANQCNLTKDTVKKNLIIDTFTYTFFWEIPQPIFGDFYFLTATTGNIPPISHGLLMQCQFLPGTVKNKAVRLGDFCCIPSKNQEDSNN